MNDGKKQRNMTAVYLLRGEKMLLLYRKGSRVVNNLWVASAGGHFEEKELNHARACALRELQEELSVTEDMLSDLRLRYITLRQTPEEIRLNFYFFAEFTGAGELTSNEGELRWFDREEITTLEMPVSAKNTVAHYWKTGRYDDKLYVGATNESSVIFTPLPPF